MSLHKIVVYVPLDHAEKIREAVGAVGGGKIGKYSYCSFSTRGIGRYKPDEGARPHIGEVGKLEKVEEERIEFVCNTEIVGKILSTIKEVHPYEEVAMDVWPLQSW